MCQSCVSFNAVQSEAFAENMITMLNQGATALMVSIGHRTGLFDALHHQPPLSSEELAGKAGLNERYVREWLYAMAIAKIVEVSPDGRQFKLPDEHAAFLTRESKTDNIALFAQYIGVLAFVEDKIVACFRNGGGVHYEEYNRFHEVMSEDSGLSILSSLFDTILPLVPGIQDRLEEGINVLDVGCGKGKALLQMAQKYPNSQFLGYDLCLEPLEEAQQAATALGLDNIRFEQKDLTYFDPEEGQFDLITAFDAIHDQARPDNVLKGIQKGLKEDGYFLMQDVDASSNVVNNFDHPLGPLMYTISTMHCMTVSLAGGGMGLGTMWGTEKAQQMLHEAGFRNVDIQRLEHDIQNCYFIIRK